MEFVVYEMQYTKFELLKKTNIECVPFETGDKFPYLYAVRGQLGGNS